MNDNAVDIIAYSIKDKIVTIPLIERKYPPLGLALPGGFVENDEFSWDAAIRELKEELNLEPLNGEYQSTSFYSGEDPNGNLQDPRRKISTIGYIFKVDLKNIKAMDDAKAYKLIKINLDWNLIIQIKEEIGTNSLAMPRHLFLLLEALEEIRTKEL